jgi:Tfp pilus assembly protein PilX
MTRRLKQQDGWALLTAMVMLALMVSIGLATFAYVDTQTASSTRERVRESAFNLDEGVLGQQAYLLANKFPASAVNAFPDCAWSTGQATATATGGPLPQKSPCLAPATLTGLFTNPDYATGVTWTTRVRDNQGTQACAEGSGTNCSYFYDDTSPTVQAYPGCTALASCYSWDQNGDNEMWVRSQATVRGKKHVVVELVRVDKRQVQMPRTVLNVGKAAFRDRQNGSVVTNGASVNLRCSQGCITNLNAQIQPASAIQYGNTAQVTMQPNDLEAMIARAAQENALYQDCPTDPPGSLVVVVGTSTTECDKFSLPVTNGSSFGTYIQLNGKFRNDGTSAFFGLVYMANGEGPAPYNTYGPPLSDSDVFYDNGNMKIFGSLIVDGPGGAMLAGGSQSAISFDDRAFTTLWSYGNRNVVKGSFREING